MKIYIIFVAFLLIFSMLLCYVEDMNDYVRLQVDLKALAEDCACAGALTVNKKGVIKEKTARKYAQTVISESNMFKDGSISIEKSSVTKDGRGYSIELVYECGELFRLPFLSVTSVRRASEYAWE